MTGWVKLHRKFSSWQWYDDANTMRVFLHLILNVNHAPKQWRGVDVGAGQVVTSPDQIATALGLSRQQVRTSINKLKSTSDITTKPTNKYTLVELVNWRAYQCEVGQDNHQTNQQITNKQPTNNQQITTNKNVKNIKNEKNDNKSKRAAALNYDSWPEPAEPDLLADWLAMRKRVKASVSQRAIDTIGTQLHIAKASGYSVNDCLRDAEASSWKGFKASWMQNSRNGARRDEPQRKTVQQQLNERRNGISNNNKEKVIDV